MVKNKKKSKLLVAGVKANEVTISDCKFNVGKRLLKKFELVLYKLEAISYGLTVRGKYFACLYGLLSLARIAKDREI